MGSCQVLIVVVIWQYGASAVRFRRQIGTELIGSGSSTVLAQVHAGGSTVPATGGLRRVSDTESFGGSSTMPAIYSGGLG